MFLIAISQGGISSWFALGRLRNHLPTVAPVIVGAPIGAAGGPRCVGARVVDVEPKAGPVQRHRHRQHGVHGVVAAVHLRPHGGAGRTVVPFGRSRSSLDVALIAVSNILIFSIWYWIIDPPGVVEGAGRGARPVGLSLLPAARMRSAALSTSWVPRYSRLRVYLAFTTSFAFSPTDTLPLTRSAKMLMLLQSTISVVTLTGIAGSAINILAGGS